jgi:hypothetical protein
MQGFHCKFYISYSINGFFIFRFCNHLYIDSVISEGFEYQAVDLGVVSHTNSHQKKAFQCSFLHHPKLKHLIWHTWHVWHTGYGYFCLISCKRCTWDYCWFHFGNSFKTDQSSRIILKNIHKTRWHFALACKFDWSDLHHFLAETRELQDLSNLVVRRNSESATKQESVVCKPLLLG